MRSGAPGSSEAVTKRWQMARKAASPAESQDVPQAFPASPSELQPLPLPTKKTRSRSSKSWAGKRTKKSPTTP
nr:MAG TPA: hypothetical protein [Caudoviricetes sp.]